ASSSSSSSSAMQSQSKSQLRSKSGGGEEEEEEEEEEYEEYEVELEKPYGLRFVKGRDGGTYIDAIAPGSAADKTGMFAVGDKVLATSAVFGTEIWPAAEYGRTMYTIRQRIGPLLMKMQRRYGKPADASELTEKEIIRGERNAGVISNKVREIQMQNYKRKMEQKKQREEDLREGLKLYKDAKYEEALEKFESVLGSRLEPEEASVASYNVACCYSKLNQVEAALSALEDAMEAGYEDFKLDYFFFTDMASLNSFLLSEVLVVMRWLNSLPSICNLGFTNIYLFSQRIRSDPDLANLRASKEFEPLMKKFDESFINENAINAIKSIFGIFNKK
ncbi:hypothetical protein ACMD2_03403, partial [Ananas comosus]